MGEQTGSEKSKVEGVWRRAERGGGRRERGKKGKSSNSSNLMFMLFRVTPSWAGLLNLFV